MAFLLILFLVLLVAVGVFYRNIPTPRPLYSMVHVREVQTILTKYFPYYQQLSPARQKTFLQRVMHFIHQKQFIARGFRPVTMEMKAMIGASAVQLTFGLPKVSLAHFKRILIYQDDYYSTITRQYHRGEVNPRLQAIVLSWYSFVEGYADSSDARNLGLHEMAHALELENMIDNEEYQFFPTEAQQRWKQLVAQYIPRIETGEMTFFGLMPLPMRRNFLPLPWNIFSKRPVNFTINIRNYTRCWHPCCVRTRCRCLYWIPGNSSVLFLMRFV